ncbi:Baculoviral IAP repeat-containing protein 6 [Psilocybe cubensis]|uniref:Baculoviral IAP repeat-containing protein 6 n=2 Tax=Psilocybe cubensis TaxID=181762 RepID=A0ACB8H4Y0_PSICU|nr:Baculoviral IAP repeat-containing protein 6 [Psilocybe cubensis]KAH9482978.1 Baculoviral IAP repeat-containing protein 6 [Psilocybe cubensis]
MSEVEVQQLVEMGATHAQARAALKQYKDVMQAAERFFEGKFDHIKDEDVEMSSSRASPARDKVPRPATPSDDEDMDDAEDQDEDEDDDDDGGDYVDYDSDFGEMNGITATSGAGNVDVDPYSGIFFSKDRKEEVIEIDEIPETIVIHETNESVPLVTQGQWMKGCPEGGEQSFLFSLYSQLSTDATPCPHDCGASISRNKGDFFALHANFTTYIDRLRSRVTKICPRCHSKMCLACGEPVSIDHEKHAASREDPLFHCSNLQGVILGVGLIMLDQLYSQQVLDSDDLGVRTAKKRKPDGSNVDGDDEDSMYYGPGKKAKSSSGIGYDGDATEDNTGQLKALANQRSKDEKISKLMSSIRVYLPNLNREGGGRTSDYLVHPTALAHLRRRFNHICSSLLRNDSLADMSDRSVLYFELLEWLETVSNHEALASMMAMPIMVVASVKSVVAKNNQARERTIVYEGSSGPRELLEGIAIQARAALKGLEGNKVVEPTPEELTEEQKRMTVDAKEKAEEEITSITSDENMKLLRFCRRILATVSAIDRSLRDTKGDAFVERLHASLPNISSSADVTQYRVEAGASQDAIEHAYSEWATRVRFEYCDLTVPTAGQDDDVTPHYKFFYDNEARMLANSDIPKRSLAIAKELAILTTNLPVSWGSSIFLRVDETRVDVIKALITGPEGTPYHNGCYLFDIFLGPSYNQSPPNVKYMTTNGGKYRFNPNLYADGKVCLSLLGTWQGPGWVSGKSTLLQVLISIQSMILCDEPYLNEPGWATGSGTPASQAYSANVRRMVVRTAMLGNLKNPPEPFAEVIQTHFRLKANSIIAQLDEWLSKDDGKSTAPDGAAYSGVTINKADSSGSSNGFAKDIEELKGLLKSLGD